MVADADSSAEFTPLVQLEKVDTDSGEKDENLIFKQRCALYRFSPDTDEWKERGKGGASLKSLTLAPAILFKKATHAICCETLKCALARA